MKIEFSIDRIDGFVPSVAQQVEMPITDNILMLPKNHGTGFFTQMVFNNNLTLVYYELDLINSTSIIRHKSENDDILSIVFWITNAGVTQNLLSEKKPVGKNTRNGITFASTMLEANYNYPPGVSIKSITVMMNKKWLVENIHSQNDYISNYIFKQEKYFIYEEISLAMEEVIATIESVIKNNLKDTLARLQLQANTINLITLFFKKLLERSSENKFINIKPHDIENLFKVKSIIAENYIDFPTIDFLAKESGMNERKLQKLFKQVFGKSIYQYALTLKMSESKKLLQSKKYTVSEVGYMVGYANLSHFTQKFKAHFGTTPKVYLSSL